MTVEVKVRPNPALGLMAVSEAAAGLFSSLSSSWSLTDAVFSLTRLMV